MSKTNKLVDYKSFQKKAQKKTVVFSPNSLHLSKLVLSNISIYHPDSTKIKLLHQIYFLKSHMHQIANFFEKPAPYGLVGAKSIRQLSGLEQTYDKLMIYLDRQFDALSNFGLTKSQIERKISRLERFIKKFKRGFFKSHPFLDFQNRHIRFKPLSKLVDSRKLEETFLPGLKNSETLLSPVSKKISAIKNTNFKAEPVAATAKAINRKNQNSLANRIKNLHLNIKNNNI